MGWPTPLEALDRATTPPFMESSSLLAGRVSLGWRDWYSEPLSINGHAVLALDARAGTVRVLIAVRAYPWEDGGRGAREEWRLAWERLARALPGLRSLGARPVSVDEEWIALGAEADRARDRFIAHLVATARRLAGVRGYTGRSSSLYGYDLPSGSYGASEILQKAIILVTTNMIAGLEVEAGPEGAWEAVRLLAENSLYLGLDADLAAVTGEPPREAGEVYTVRRLHRLLSEAFEGEGPEGAVSLESLRRALREYMRHGAARTCRAEAADRSGARRSYEAVYFDLRHELSLAPFMLATGGYGGMGKAIGCALLPYITGAGHSRWTRSPGALEECLRACKALGLHGEARRHEMERRGWPDHSPVMPGPCHGARRVLAVAGLQG